MFWGFLFFVLVVKMFMKIVDLGIFNFFLQLLPCLLKEGKFNLETVKNIKMAPSTCEKGLFKFNFNMLHQFLEALQ